MPSHLIIGPAKSAAKQATKLTPFPIEPNPDCFIAPQEENSLKIAHVRAIKSFLTRKPYHHDHQLVVIPEAHRLTIPAQNALLKTLEEPPGHAIIILSTHYPDRLLPTIVSRCHLHLVASKTPAKTIDVQISGLISGLTEKTVSQKIKLAASYALPKTKAVITCQSIINYYRSLLKTSPSITTAQNAALAQQMLTYLEANADPKLCLEHLFLYLI